MSIAWTLHDKWLLCWKGIFFSVHVSETCYLKHYKMFLVLVFALIFSTCCSLVLA